jgi:GNAT superfamily N-acetyltransferase
MQGGKYKISRLDFIDQKTCAIIERIHKTCFPDDDVLSPLTGGYWWIVKYGPEIIGFCAMRQSSRWIDTGYLCRSAVIRTHRGKGLQKRMIRVREQFARKLGLVFMITDTNDNPTSANNLIDAGYIMYRPTWPYGIETTCYWKKRL